MSKEPKSSSKWYISGSSNIVIADHSRGPGPHINFNITIHMHHLNYLKVTSITNDFILILLLLMIYKVIKFD